MTETRWLTPSESRAWRALRQFQTPLATALNRQLLRDSTLSSADYEVLVVLSESDAGGAPGRRTRPADRLGEEPAVAPHQADGRPATWWSGRTA